MRYNNGNNLLNVTFSESVIASTNKMIVNQC
jgi:hypothetical protein